MQTPNVKKLGELLIEASMITPQELDQALKAQKGTGKKLGEVLIELGLVTELQTIEVLEFMLKIPKVDFKTIHIENEAIRMVSEAIAKKYILIPVKINKDKLTVAMSDPQDIMAIDDLVLTSGMEIDVVIGTKAEINSAIERYYGREGAEKAVEDIKKELSLEQINTMNDVITDEINNAPVVRFVNSIINHAVRAKASDIHIEPYEDVLRIRFRIDGELQEIIKSSKNAHSAVVTRIKIMSSLDIAEKRIPQDGRVETVIDNKEIDLRISILPTVFGEKVVIRILGRSDNLLSKEQLGFNERNIKLFEKIIQSPNGIILVTGPTGSGKTTTLYAILNELNKINRNIITVEDPVEYRMQGVNQVQVNVKAGLQFSSALRSILRQDPDIIMIGEIRDGETAEIAVRAAITGHLVLSTMHTNDAATAVTRLVDMGVEPFLVSSSVVGVVAQRLVKKICNQCKTSYKPSTEEMLIMKLKEGQLLYKGSGCSYCGFTGYKGRTAIHEVMPVNSQIRMLVDKRSSIDNIRNVAAKAGTESLNESCADLVLQGITTIDELIRATYVLE